MRFLPKQRIQETQPPGTEKNGLWAIAFSPDTFVDEQKATTAANVESNVSEQQGDCTRYHCFATCGGPRVTIYEYETGKGDNRKNNKNFHVRQTFTSSNTNEDFYALTFGRRRSRLGAASGDGKEWEDRRGGVPERVVCVGGKCGLILILNVDSGSLQATLEGSIGYIADLKFISCVSGDRKYNLLCSASIDQVRLWNLDTLANICIFAGDPHGHMGDVLSVAWHPTGSRIVSGGAGPIEKSQEDENYGLEDKKDGRKKKTISAKDLNTSNNGKKFQICIWNVTDSSRLQEAIQASSYLPPFVDDRSQFNPLLERFAASMHNDVHSQLVDCVAWLGDLVLSKSVQGTITLWQPLKDESSCISTVSTSESSILPIKVFEYTAKEHFISVRFALSMGCSSSLLAIGNDCDKVYLWDLSDFDNDGHTQCLNATPQAKKKKSTTKKENAIIRGLAFSPDGETLVGCDSYGGVFRCVKN